MRFRRTRKGIEVRCDEVEAVVLARAAADLLELLPEVPADPFEALIGTGEKPDDPALQRLFPDAYADDEAAASDFRRFTETELRAGKRANAAGVLETIPPGGGTVLLTDEQVQQWLGMLNDLRLVLGTRLGVTEDTDPWEADSEAHHVYGWLGYLQESLLEQLLS